MAQALNIVQGDKLSKTFAIKSNLALLTNTDVSKVYFTCNDLGIQKELEFVSGRGFKLELTPTETEALLPCKTTFDITIDYGNSVIRTALYEYELEVLEKSNGVDYD